MPRAYKIRGHVRLRLGDNLDDAALSALIDAAYSDIKSRLVTE